MANWEGPWLQVRQMTKHFGGVRALSEVDMDIHRGEVHGLVGANGAGKSTLIRCLAGVTAPDHGTVRLDGVPTTIATPRDAEQAGLAFIHQELNLVPHFSSLENILLGAPKVTRLGLIDWKRSSRAAYEAAERIGVRFSLSRRVDELTVAERWLVMISKALVRRASMIAMDEPTASLSDAETNQLFKVVRDLAAHGVAILYVSHRLDEVLDLSDRITVFRDGRVAQEAVRGDLDKRGLIRAIVGREVTPVTRTQRVVARTAPRNVIFEACEVTRRPAVRGVSFQLFAGEVLGLAGLVGAGRTELARLAARRGSDGERDIQSGRSAGGHEFGAGQRPGRHRTGAGGAPVGGPDAGQVGGVQHEHRRAAVAARIPGCLSSRDAKSQRRALELVDRLSVKAAEHQPAESARSPAATSRRR